MSRRFCLPTWLVLILFLAIPSFYSQADTISVNTTTDEFGAGTGCALREAVQAANTNADFGGCTRVAAGGVDVITIPVGTYTLDLGAVGDDTNAEGDLDVTESVTINGAGAASTIIRNGYGAGGTDGDGDRIFHIDPGAAVGTVDVTITGVTIRDADLGCSVADCIVGGATIYKESTGFLTIENSFLLDNQFTCDAAGCGDDENNTAVIHVDNGGDLTLSSVTMTGNTASCSFDDCETGNVLIRMNGSSGNLTIENSTITDNHGFCDGNNGCDIGELIHDNVANDDVIIRNTIINDNSLICISLGDGSCNISELLEFDDVDSVTINNVTIDGNVLSCTSIECDTDELLSAFDLEEFNILNSQISNNFQECDGLGDFCETEALIAGALSDEVNFDNVRISDNEIFCAGDFCTASYGDSEAMVDLSFTGGVTFTEVRMVDNEVSCEGGLCLAALRLWLGDDYTIERSTIARNIGSCEGVDCFVEANAVLESFLGTARIIDTTFDRNESTCNSADCIALVAGMVLAGSEETIVRRSTISNNMQACDDAGGCGPFPGGGIVIVCGCGGTVRFFNSTISGNTTTGHGGGILHIDGNVFMNNVTIADNVADSDNDGIGDGGGVYIDSTDPFRIRNTLIARNQDPTSDPDCFGTLQSQGFNLIGSLTANCNLVGNLTGNIINVAARIGPLANNGGFTLTHALLPDSPALNAGDNGTCENDDQRFTGRPLGAICDIGAYEAGLTVGGDPPIWNDIMVFPTPERAFGADLDGNGYVGDTVLRYINLATGEIVNTGLPVSNRHRDVDLYENTIVFVEQTNYPMGLIYAYDLATGELMNTGMLGYRPTIYGDIISVSGTTVRYYDLNTDRFVDTRIPGEAQAIWGNVIAFHRASDQRFHPTIRYYDIQSGDVVNTKAAGQFPAIYENFIAFTTNENLIAEDLNGDGDLQDSILRYYDLETKQVVNTGQVGRHPAIYGNHIVFSQGRHVRYYDIETGQTFDTGLMGTEPDIFGNTVTYYVWEDWAGDDLNADGDRHDPIIGIFDIPQNLPERTLVGDRNKIVETTPNGVPQPLSVSKALSYPNPAPLAQTIQFQVQGEGIESIQVTVYDLAGQLVFSSDWNPGNRLSWNQFTSEGNPVANGVYLYIVTATGNGSQARSAVQKLVVLR